MQLQLIETPRLCWKEGGFSPAHEEEVLILAPIEWRPTPPPTLANVVAACRGAYIAECRAWLKGGRA